MKLEVKRDIFTKEYTQGTLSIDGEFFCYTLEDTDRFLENGTGEKVYSKTAIPRGTYEVQLSYSPKFKRTMPILLNVPNFTAIRIHTGNTVEDTNGCILLGTSRTEQGTITESRKVFDKFFPLLVSALSKDKVFITVE